MKKIVGVLISLILLVSILVVPLITYTRVEQLYSNYDYEFQKLNKKVDNSEISIKLLNLQLYFFLSMLMSPGAPPTAPLPGPQAPNTF